MRHGVSFVSVTQQFNTTTSMGRLTLNVLLSFAQFEREVTSERIRDKIAASKRKGLWVGGIAPLGYETKDRKIVVVEEEAERVRTIFRRYLELGSLNLLMADLRERGIVTKVRSLKTGRTVGGIPFTRGPLAHFLRNRFYIGEVVFKGEVLPGEQPAILDRDLFDAVQAKLNDHRNNQTVARGKIRVLAYRLQADQLGDLDVETVRLLDRSGSPEKAGQRAVSMGQRTAELRPGTLLGREWNGQMHRVAVLAEGFAWNGKTYRSLTKVAFAITGTRWSGPKFFGLRDRPSKGSAP